MNQHLFYTLVLLLSVSPLSFAQTQLPGSLGSPVAEVKTAASPALESGTTPRAGCCFDGCAGGGERIWFQADYLLWWFKNSPNPVPLATSFPQTTTSLVPGAIGQPDTTVLLGGQDIDTNVRHGGRLAIGSWVGRDSNVGVEGSYFYVASRGTNSVVTSGSGADAPFLTIPYFDAVTGTEDVGPLLAGPINAPGFTSHTASLTTSSRLMGAEGNGIWKLVSRDDLRVSFLGGFRWLQLNESLTFADSVIGEPGTLAEGFVFNSLDEFSTRNDFYGGQLGARFEFSRGRLLVNATGKVALGAMHENVVINGVAVTNFFGGPVQTLPGGIFAQQSNMGSFNRDRFAVVPEVNLNVGYKVTDRTRVHVGYTFLYVSDVARPGNQIDRVINPTQTNFANTVGLVPTPPARPEFNFNHSDFWAHGINFGIELRF